MTNEEVMQLMTDMGLHEGGMDDWVFDNAWVMFANAVASAEREACANSMAYLVMTPTLTHGALVKLSDVVNAIRARGDKHD